jgi:putative phosphoesterase
LKIGVVSDVHNNVEALTYALAQLHGCAGILSLGDLVSDHRVTRDILRLAESAQIQGIAGNHEKTILLHSGSRLRYKLAPVDLAHLQALPASRDFEMDGRHVRVVHGAPWDDPTNYRCAYVTESDAEALDGLRSTGADLVLLGHTHIAMALRLGRTLALNPGSCGEGRDEQRRLTYAELDFSAGVATVFQVKHGLQPEPLLRADF